MDKTYNVKENLMDILKPVFGEVPVAKGAIEEQVKRLWIMEFGDVPADLLRQTSSAAQYEFEKFPTRKQYHDLLIKISSMRPMGEKPKTAHDEWLESVNQRQDATAMFLSRIEPELHEATRDRAVQYYLDHNLCVADEVVRGDGNTRVVYPTVDANAKLKNVMAMNECDRNVYQSSVAALLRSTVFEHLQQTGHLAAFSRSIGL